MESFDSLDPIERNRIVRIAVSQRHVLYAMAANIFWGLGYYASVTGHAPMLPRSVFMIGALGIGILGSVAAYRLANELFGLVAAVLCCLALVVPLLNLAALLIINGRATRELRRYRLKIGLLGVYESELRRLRGDAW